MIVDNSLCNCCFDTAQFDEPSCSREISQEAESKEDIVPSIPGQQAPSMSTKHKDSDDYSLGEPQARFKGTLNFSEKVCVHPTNSRPFAVSFNKIKSADIIRFNAHSVPKKQQQQNKTKNPVT